jgi:hypothetical protein
MVMQGKHNMAGPDFLMAIVFIIFGIAVCATASQMRVFRTLLVSPGLFPMILGAVFIVCGLVILRISFKNGGLGRAKDILSAAYLQQAVASPRFKRGGIVFLLILAYVVLFGNNTLAVLNFSFTVGDVIFPVNTSFILITFGYLFATFMYLKALSARNAALVSGIAALVIFYVFSKGFGIPIP